MLNHIFHGSAQAAGRIHGDQNEAGMLLSRLADAAIDVFGHDRLDFVADSHFDYAGPSG